MSNQLLIIKDGLTYDASGLVESYQWQGKNSSPARTLKVSLLDSEKNAGGRCGVDVEKGQQCIFLRDGVELFRGMFMRQEQNHNRMMTLTAYDNGIYLSNNKDYFNYSYKTASFIFKDVCKRFGIPYAAVAETGHVVDELPAPKTTGYDVICDALQSTYEATGSRFFIKCEKEKLSLLKRVDNVVQWVIASEGNIASYNYSKSIEKIKTRIALLDRHDSVEASKVDSELESRIGIFKEIASAENGLSSGKLKELAASMLKEKSMPEKSLAIEALGHVEVVSGVYVYVIIPHLGLEKSFYVESDSHSFRDGMHTMNITLLGVEESYI